MPKAVDPQVKHSEFMQASVAVIAAEGLSSATLRRIARHAGCTTGALTHYFANRNDLLLATLRYVHHNAGARMLQVTGGSLPPAAQLRAVLEESLPLDDTRYREWRVWLAFWGAAMQASDLSRENARRYEQWSGLVRALLTPLIPASALEIESKRMVDLVDGMGVSIAREQPGSAALTLQRQDCLAVLEHHLQLLLHN